MPQDDTKKIRKKEKTVERLTCYFLWVFHVEKTPSYFYFTFKVL